MKKIACAVSYDYPMGGQYNETIATLDDGRIVTVNTQYACVLPHGDHQSDCDQINKMGGCCTCGLLDGIDVTALVADARINGKRGRRPEEIVHQVKSDPIQRHHAMCPKCGTYCYGDCQS